MNKDGIICVLMMDGCDLGGNVIVWYDRLVYNFYQYYYDNNRVFFGMYMYVIFFLLVKGSDYMIVVKKFFKYVEDLGDVWILIFF